MKHRGTYLCALSAIIGLFGATTAAAQTCPDFYRFVDFGAEDQAGIMYRSGPLLRAENFDEDRLLLEDQTECLPVWPTLTDGRGNTIPVVSSISYDPAVIGADITELKVRSDVGTVAAANQPDTAYHRQLERPDTTVTRGGAFVCVQSAGALNLACQLVSPFGTDTPLIVYCDEQSCQLPVLALDDRIFVSARWDAGMVDLNDPETGAASMIETVQVIYDFISPLSASFQ